jgi:hypothetical protein
VQFRAIEAASGLREPHFLQVVREHGEVPPLVAAELEQPTLQSLFLALLAAAGVEPEALYTAPGRRRTSCSPSSCSSTISSSRGGASATSSSSSASSAR